MKLIIFIEIFYKYNTSMDIPLFKVFMAPPEDIDTELCNILHSGMITQGKKVEEFESLLKTFFNYPYILTLNSATSGLTLALRLLDLSPDDEILTTALTCAATNWPILSHNLKIKWVDTDPDTLNIDLEDLKNKITSTTKAIMFVHWGGSPVDLKKIDEIKKYTMHKFGFEIKVIEDCAHAFGAKFDNSFVGTYVPEKKIGDDFDTAQSGNICVFSLQAIKHLTTGDGGLIFLPNKQMYERAKLLRWFGIDREKRTVSSDIRMEPDVEEWGYKFHMNDINATIGIANLKYIEKNLDISSSNARFYDQELGNLNGLTLLKRPSQSESANWLYTIKIKKRDEFIEFMKQSGVTTSQVHQRNDIHSCVSKFKTSLPNLDFIQSSYVSIPVGWWVTKKDRERICQLIKKFLFKDQVKIRELIIEDFNKGYLNLFNQLNGVNLNYNSSEFEKRYQDIKTQGSKVFVAIHNDEIIGTAKVFIENKFWDKAAHIEDVVVDSKFRHLGICKLLVSTIETLAITIDCYKIILECKDSNISIYSTMGFEKISNSLVKKIK